MQVNTVTQGNKNNNLNFGIKISGKISSEICKEIYDQKLNKYMPSYVQQYEKLSKSGLETSELYLAKGKDVDTFMLKNPSITTAYEKPLMQAQKGNLLEAWFNIKPEDIQNAEKMLKEAITEKRQGLVSMADNVVVRALLYGKNNEKEVSKAVEKLDDNTVIDLFYQAKNIVKS